VASDVFIPEDLWRVPYVAARHPGTTAGYDVALGANCQLFAYALLARHGLFAPHQRSSELWKDRERTRKVTELLPLDLLLFNRTPDAFGAHVAVYLGDERAIHLSKAAGLPRVDTLRDFARQADYACFIGAKRVSRVR
jgi:lipoprotein Spr